VPRRVPAPVVAVLAALSYVVVIALVAAGLPLQALLLLVTALFSAFTAWAVWRTGLGGVFPFHFAHGVSSLPCRSRTMRPSRLVAWW